MRLAPSFAAAERQQDEAPPQTARFRWTPHPSLHWPNGTHIDFRVRVQGDISASEGTENDKERSAIDLARRRVGIGGEIARVIGFQFERELASEDPWRDVYAEYRRFTVIRTRGGHFKLPFSLDENTSPADLDFVFRSLAATRLAPGRDWGVMAEGRVAGRTLRYEAGVFDRDGRNARTRRVDRVSGGATFAGRVVLRPFRASRTAVRELLLGAAVTRSEVREGLSGVRGRTVLDASFFPADVWVRGPRRRIGLEAQWLPGPFSIKAEHIRLTTARLGQSVEDTDLSPLVATGWYVSGTGALGGARKTRGLNAPKRPLLRGGVGIVEFAARLEALRFSSGGSGQPASTSPRAEHVLGNEDRAATFGVNWYLNRWAKIQANVIRERISDPSRGPVPARPAFWSRVVRLQFSL